MILPVLLALLIQQPTEKKPVPLPGTFAHPFHAYKLLLPAGWARGPNHAKAQASFYAAKVEAYTPRVDLYIHKGVKEFGPFATKLRESFRSAYPDATFPVDELTSVRGRTALFLQVAFSDGDIRMKTLWMAVMREDRVYQLGWACTAPFFDRYAAAIEAMFKSLRLYPEPEVPEERAKEFMKVYGEAETLYRQGKFREAVERFRDAALILPDYPEIHATVGTALMRLKLYAEAEAAYRKAQQLDPDDASHAFNFGNALLQQEKFKPAIEALSRAAKAEPWMEPAWTNLGAAKIATQDYAGAAEALEKAVAADPESVAAHYNLGAAYESLKEKAKAAAQFREALKLDPRHIGAQEGLKRVE